MAKKKKQTHITFVLDRSGSMFSCAGDTVGAYNQFLAEQSDVKGKCTATLIQFDTVIETVYREVPIAEAKQLATAFEAEKGDKHVFEPRGMTALLDAVGESITHGYDEGRSYVDKGRQQIVVILTDGQENSSREWSKKSLRDEIERLQAQGWQFIFLGANDGAFAEAGAMGIPQGTSMNYADNVAAGVSLTSSNIRSFRETGDAASLSYTPEQRKQVERSPTSDEYSKVMSDLGRRGGKARAEKMTPEERSESARKASEVRWLKEDSPA